MIAAKRRTCCHCCSARNPMPPRFPGCSEPLLPCQRTQPPPKQVTQRVQSRSVRPTYRGKSLPQPRLPCSQRRPHPTGHTYKPRRRPLSSKRSPSLRRKGSSKATTRRRKSNAKSPWRSPSPEKLPGPTIVVPEPLSRAAPRYPVLAERRKIEGSVELNSPFKPTVALPTCACCAVSQREYLIAMPSRPCGVGATRLFQRQSRRGGVLISNWANPEPRQSLDG